MLMGVGLFTKQISFVEATMIIRLLDVDIRGRGRVRMTIESPHGEYVEELREVARVEPQLYPDGEFWFNLRHPADGLVLRVGFDDDEAQAQLFNHEEVLTQESVKLSGDVQADIQQVIECVYRGWRDVVL
jgi:hypothetical protein